MPPRSANTPAPGAAPTSQVPVEIGSRADDQLLGSYRKLAYAFDEMFRVPGTGFRFGLDSIVGLIPGAGDIAVTSLGAYALLLAFKLKAPASVLARMLANIGIDTVFGAVPFLGDLFDAAWKANTKNRHLLEAWLADPARTTRKSAVTLVVFAVLFLLMVAGSLWLAWIVLSYLLTAPKA
jgi:hypothetical protein